MEIIDIDSVTEEIVQVKTIRHYYLLKQMLINEESRLLAYKNKLDSLLEGSKEEFDKYNAKVVLQTKLVRQIKVNINDWKMKLRYIYTALEDTEQKIFMLRFINLKKPQEIADELHLALGSVYNAISKLNKIIEKTKEQIVVETLY